MRHLPKLCAAIAAALLPGAMSWAGDAVRCVDASAAPGGDGESWKTAYHDLQDALDDASMKGSAVSEIWIAAGAYRPDRETGDRLASFQLVNGVALLGGFAGDESSRDQRDPSVNITILTGDLNDDDDAGGSIAENSYHVLSAMDVDATTVLDGLVVRAGNADGETPDNVGAGMYCLMGSPTVRNCTFENNIAQLQGAGVYNLFGDTSFTGCRFIDNNVVNGGGGGVFTWLGKPAFIECDFINNNAGVSGAGLALQTGGIRMLRCRFIGNTAGIDGGGIYKGAGDVVMTNCTFLGNQATFGGGIFDGGSETSLTLINCLVHGNSGEGGGGVVCDGALRVLNSTISQNQSSTSGLGAGLFTVQGDLLEVNNAIIWGNNAAGSTNQTAQIFAGFLVPAIDYSCIQGWTGAWGGEGNIGDDPLFLDADGEDDILGNEDDDARLNVGSPCENTGDNALLPLDEDDLDDDEDTAEALPRDLDESARIIGATVDMGAYERAGDITGDLNGDGSVGPTDLAILLGSWGACPGCPPDLDGDGVVGPADLAVLLGNWG